MKKNLFILLFLLFIAFTVQSQWVRSNGPNKQNIYSLLTYGSSLYAATNEGIYSTSNNGYNWFQRNNGINTVNNSIYCIIGINNRIFCGSDSGVYISTDNGDSWSKKNNGLPVGSMRRVKSLLFNYSSVYAATGNGVFMTTDYGDNWTPKNSGIEYQPVYSFTLKGNYIFAGSDNKVFRSSDWGLTWSILANGLPTSHSSAAALAALGSNIIAGMCCGAGAYISNDDGERWSKLNDMTANVFITIGNRIVAGAIEGILVSSDSGNTWVSYNQGLQYPTTTAIAFNAAKIFAGIELFVWYRPIGELIGIEKISSEVPVSFQLYQNYPNPFNPVTVIKFSITQFDNDIVKLSVYNTLGQHLSELVNKKLSAGTYEVEFDAGKAYGRNDYPSGIYFYSLITGKQSITKKMILLK